MPAITTVVFDVNETLTDMAPLATRFAEVGAAAGTDALWFASLLRDAFAVTAAGGTLTFRDVARSTLLTVLQGVASDPLAAAEHVLAGLATLPVHPDVVPALTALHGAGLQLVTLTNGSAASTEQLLERAGVRGLVSHVLSVDDAGAWKPARPAYEHALASCGAAASQVALVAVHPWDVHGAARAGWATVWVDRVGAPYPAPLRQPGATVRDLRELTGCLHDLAAATDR